MIFTTQCSDLYAEGLQLLILSVKRFIPGVRWHVLEMMPAISPDHRRSLIETGIDIVIDPLTKYGTFAGGSSGGKQRLVYFRLPYNQLVCNIGADMLCLNDPSEISTFEHITSADSPAAGERPLHNGQAELCADFLCFRPSESLLTEMENYCINTPGMPEATDEMLMNEFFSECHPGLVKLKSNLWDMRRCNEFTNVRSWQPELAKFVHYSSDWKYWFPDPATGSKFKNETTFFRLALQNNLK
jgi:hypothetical protein